jgi:hypothetical protein
VPEDGVPEGAPDALLLPELEVPAPELEVPLPELAVPPPESLA